MFDFEIAFYLYKMSKIQSVFLNSEYRAKSYYSAAMALDAHDKYVSQMYEKNALKEIPYVGSKIEKCIIEIIETGELAELREYEERFGIEDYSLLLGTGLSEGLIQKLWDLSLRSIRDLREEGAMDVCAARLKKGETAKIRQFVEGYNKLNGKYLFAYGDCLGGELKEFLREIDGMKGAVYSGEMLSAVEKIERIEILFSYDGSWAWLVEKLKNFPRISVDDSREGAAIEGRTKFGIPFLFVAGTGEKEALTPEPEIAVTLKDIRGDLHSHTMWTDGIHSLEQMLDAAWERGYEYMAITDHTVSLKVAHGLAENQAVSQIEEIRKYAGQHAIKPLAGIEVDILEDGRLDYGDDVLSRFDFVVAAIHSHMKQSAFEMEERLRRALSNPYVNILAHPTGRLLGKPGVLFSEREPYALGAERLIDLCREYGVAMEINCFPERLDIGVEYARMAAEKGVELSLGTDAHSMAHLRNMEYGLRVVNKAGIAPSMVINTYDYKKLCSFFSEQRTKNRLSRSTEPVSDKRRKDFRYYFGNNTDILQGNKKVIGIDLTGSEEKESGWAFMQGSSVVCRRIGTDAELIQSVREWKPDIVSIDSPLAYPKGRCCSRKGCECSKYGIMRSGERILRHFSIPVYPCLIDSMVNLTTRGMKLARYLRGEGYTVIESYPGVAQDILKIPRKGKTQEQFLHLKQGLRSFGITGDLVTNPDISHDEVDAVTSALVGYFYLNDQYVGLGNEDEDYLIIPRVQEDLLKRRVIIGLSGETGAGKTTVSEYLRFKYGFEYFRYSQVIEQKYQVHDKTELQRVGAMISMDEEKQRDLTRCMIQGMKPGKGYVIDGIRHYEDYDELRKHFGRDFLFLYIDCRYSNRYKRYNKLKQNSLTKADFEKINNHPAERDIGFLQLKADYQMDNNGGYKDLCAQIDRFIKNESKET